jgi:E3 ubiquitin-protein ligase TRIP12
MLGRPVDLFHIRKFDASLGISLERLHAAYRLWASGSSDAPLVLDGALIEDLCLTFVLPGMPPGHICRLCPCNGRVSAV